MTARLIDARGKLNLNRSFHGRLASDGGAAMSSGFNRTYTIAVDTTSVYACGSFTRAGNCISGCNYIASWDGSAWSALGMGMNDKFQSIIVSDSKVYAGGAFTNARSCTSIDGFNSMVNSDLRPDEYPIFLPRIKR